MCVLTSSGLTSSHVDEYSLLTQKENIIRLILEYRRRRPVSLPYREPQRVHLAEPLLVRQRGYVLPQPLERLVDGLHAPALPQVGGVALVGGVGGVLAPAPANRRCPRLSVLNFGR